MCQQRGQNSTYHEELLHARIKLDGYNSKVSELESVNAQLKVKYIITTGRQRTEVLSF
jgi:hypothetical protein